MKIEFLCYFYFSVLRFLESFIVDCSFVSSSQDSKSLRRRDRIDSVYFSVQVLSAAVFFLLGLPSWHLFNFRVFMMIYEFQPFNIYSMKMGWNFMFNYDAIKLLNLSLSLLTHHRRRHRFHVALNKCSVSCLRVLEIT